MSKDPRLGMLSHSSMNTLSSCARKFQLARLQVTSSREETLEERLTFGMGHITGYAIQLLFETPTLTREELFWKLFLHEACTPEQILEEDKRRKKSFFYALHAADVFYSQLWPRLSSEYDLVRLPDGAPATELSFCIHIRDGYYYRGFIDAVIQHKESKQIAVLENKTSSIGATAELYANSSQGVGYTTVIDAIFPELSSLECIYLVYSTKEYSYTDLPFVKSPQDRLDFLRTLWLETSYIEMCSDAEFFPKRGSACYSFFKPCPFFGACDISPVLMTQCLMESPEEYTQIELEKYRYHFEWKDLVANYTL